MHDSFTPLGGMVPLVNIMLGEVVFGGVGAGLDGSWVRRPAVFLPGDGGRKPEYLGRRSGVRRADGDAPILIFPLVILVFTGISAASPDVGPSSVLNPGPHGLSEILYAYRRAPANKGRPSPDSRPKTRW